MKVIRLSGKNLLLFPADSKKGNTDKSYSRGRSWRNKIKSFFILHFPGYDSPYGQLGPGVVPDPGRDVNTSAGVGCPVSQLQPELPLPPLHPRQAEGEVVPPAGRVRQAHHHRG